MPEVDLNKKVFIDFETTGFKPAWPVSLAMIAYEGKKRTCAKYMVFNPEARIQTGAMKVHGITQEEAESHPTFDRVWGDIAYYFSDALVCSHNIEFDVYKVLIPTLKRYDIPIPNFKTCCTVKNAQKFLPKPTVKNHKLDTLCEYFNIPLEHHHNAGDDTYSCMRIFNELVKISHGDLVIEDQIL